MLVAREQGHHHCPHRNLMLKLNQTHLENQLLWTEIHLLSLPPRQRQTGSGFNTCYSGGERSTEGLPVYNHR